MSQERDNLFSILPVFTMCGIILFYKYNIRPSFEILCLSLITSFIFAIIYHKIIQKIALVMLFLVLGIAASKYRYLSINHHLIKRSLSNINVAGEIVNIYSGLDTSKIVLQNISVDKENRSNFPPKIQFKIDNKYIKTKLQSGDIIDFNCDIFPLPRPVYPNAYNFSEVSRYKSIGGIGIAKSDVVVVKNAKKTGFNMMIENIRIFIDERFAKNIENPDARGVAMALFTGNKGHLSQETLNDIKKAGLSHLLAISGIHISIIALSTFSIARWIMSLSSYMTLHFDIKKISAIIAMIVSFIHLEISGIPISAFRSFIMFSIGLIAILLDKSTCSIRVISATFFCIILHKPEQIFDPSLQMSFMAVLGLIGGMRPISKFIENRYGDGGRLMKLGLYIFAILISSKIATIATIPYTIYHFNQYSNVGLLSNIVAVPLVEFLIIPLGVISILLSGLFLGLDVIVMKILSFMISIFLYIAYTSADVKWSYSIVREMPMVSVFLYTIGFIILFTMRTKIRFIGIFPIICAILLHVIQPKQIIIIGKIEKDVVFLHDGIYYAKEQLSSDFLKNIWQGRVGQSDVMIADKEILNKYFSKDKFENENIVVYFNLPLDGENICKHGKRVYIVNPSPEYKNLRKRCKVNIVKKWQITAQGAFVIYEH
ncbi:ComEC family competence protein [Candidatus Deianiraea vastatrix]|uniref:ComEC family competence protein n=2 Tax=Candidatus Deianiraea vastatrix TaxID=2163644 RepID=A0A5B8XDY4_9RICK|nr:ComEC family competence protein [Candidatus Deianiraea vastatrix]